MNLIGSFYITHIQRHSLLTSHTQDIHSDQDTVTFLHFISRYVSTVSLVYMFMYILMSCNYIDTLFSNKDLIRMCAPELKVTFKSLHILGARYIICVLMIPSLYKTVEQIYLFIFVAHR